MQKLYCYVDESGQDTLGKFFIVSVIITEVEREVLEKELEELEKFSKKGRRKWMETRKEQKLAYLRGLLKISKLKGKLNYSTYTNTREYFSKTILTTARAISFYVGDEYKATIFVDGLSKSMTAWFGVELRHLRIKTEKVRGVRKEQASALMRLADAICGLVREAVEGREEFMRLLEKGKKKGFIREL